MKKLTAILSMVAAAIIIPAALFAWGPSRPTYTIANPADHVTFNSIIDNPSHGDERNFVQVREATASNTAYADSISLISGHEYVVYVYYHNNAATNLNASGVGVAHGAYVQAQIPAVVVKGSTDVKAVGYVGAINANPGVVWDDISFSNTTGGDIALRFVPGSATIHNFGATNGQALSDNIITTGANLGFDSLNGDLPGCEHFAGYVTFRVKADQPNFTISKEVRIAGSTTWSKSVVAKAGDNLEYRIQYINSGTTDQNNVVIKDVLPANISYTAGSTTIKNASNPTGKTISDNLTLGGINIGNYTAGSNAFVKFNAKVAGVNALICGTNTLTNTAEAQTNNGSKSDSAIVTVTKQCQNVPELPHTGASENILAFLGLGAMTTAAGYYLASRRVTSLNRR
ncbi:hypothetical protein COV88_02760 [Candidatus Saccharibacteria bacterium CG11_big_fil_rev_8_21_14_0_20_41_19]|nr:MAG: hypothetical protein AUK57_01635 [Candidatus Saccharibacteria bacterium CG2_30_41_52]PIQ70809.1 MAG: hypothetical protein COV88_02760 [Candidatus Saccharibacteria bacterium CG11_big_fil_rev_8_21_14_0_20_41_19]PIZ60096.1 MAG: hypothetical protein COY18_01925 [Candidatus Saccharibacteria bacterium CG_4_10_14_0_2_um_filter_41_11]PJC29543.1 MAG: hypothetical protein CO052_02805 [Candidatus Saccharibacteria bacterium CG_4_9_14_0_2_um_filter_41_9]PJE66299.1 MAG: hypothetical protein COU92_013